MTEILLSRGYEVHHLSRTKKNSVVPSFAWNIEKKELDISSFENADAIIHLAGTNLYEKRWNNVVKKNIYNSRVEGTKLLMRALSYTPNKVKSIVSASGIGYYGNRKDDLLNEDASPGKTFLAQVCADWENEARKAEELKIRAVQLRAGIVLSKNDGALKELSLPLKYFVKPIFLPGTQHWSWIHLDDVCELFIHSIENENMHGAFNATSPHAVTYSAFIRTLAQVLKKKSIPSPLPGWLLRIISGEFAATLFHDCNCSSEKILATGFQFKYSNLKSAIEDCFTNNE